MADTQTIAVPHYNITLAQPTLVARSKGYLWFPTLVRLSNGDLLAIMSNYADIETNAPTGRHAWSTDNGQTWNEPTTAPYGETHLTLKNGDELILPYYLFPKATGSMSAPYKLVPKGTHEITLVQPGVTVEGWPRPDKNPPSKEGVSGFVFNGQTIKLKDGQYLATLYGTFEQDKRYNLVCAASRDGVHWKIKSIVADEKCELEGNEGPCEAALCRLKDGRLMCVFRLGNSSPYGQVWSSDDGATWTKPVAMKDAFSVQPSLVVLPDGAVALSGGRHGLYLWLNADGTGRDWERIDIQAHHNTCLPDERIVKWNDTSSYTEIVALDAHTLLYIYDRIPNGWYPIPADSRETNSVWVVRVSLEPKP